MKNGINQSVELRIFDAKTTDFSCRNYVEELDAVADIQLCSRRAGTHVFNLY